MRAGAIARVGVQVDAPPGHVQPFAEVKAGLVAALEEQPDGGGLAVDLGERPQHGQQAAAQQRQVTGFVHGDQQRGQGGEDALTEPGERVGLVLVAVGVTGRVSGRHADADRRLQGGEKPCPAPRTAAARRR